MLQWTYTKPLGYQAPVTVGDISGSLMLDNDMVLITLCTLNEEWMYSCGRALHTDDLKARAEEIEEKFTIGPDDTMEDLAIKSRETFNALTPQEKHVGN